jgi:hypothetical protein
LRARSGLWLEKVFMAKEGEYMLDRIGTVQSRPLKYNQTWN